jgi:maleate isomerase
VCRSSSCFSGVGSGTDRVVSCSLVYQKGVAYFQNQDFEVVHASHLTPAIKVPHPNLGSDVNPAELYEWVRNHAPSNMECVFIAGNGFRAIGVIAALEEDLGRPVLTVNQVAFWYALRLAGVGAQVDDYGQLFRKNLNRH